MRRPFLTAQWRWLAMLNYRVDPAVLRPLVPEGTELDEWQGHTFVSLVGFLFRDTRVLGVPIPFHRNFEELNLRFYVRREVDGEVRRAVTFVRELVPRAAIALVARLAYNEPYLALPMRHVLAGSASDRSAPHRVQYQWRHAGEWCGVAIAPFGEGREAHAGSEEEFITEHYWGYTRQRDGSTVEYHVAHPRWRIWQVRDPVVTGDLAGLYGQGLGAVLRRPPDSAFVADGSPVEVHLPTRLPRAASHTRAPGVSP